jgi:hypothetical protein
MNDNHDHDTLRDVANEITAWQHVAQHHPLPEVNDLALASLASLCQLLNEFNTTVRHYCLGQNQDDDALAHAVSEVARHATAAAIFTLGLNQRVQITLAAETN